MNKKNNISLLHFEALIITSVIGVGILSLPTEVSNILGNDGWLLIITSGFFTMVLMSILMKLCQLYPGRVYYDFGKDIVGPRVFNIINILYLCYFLFLAAFVMRIFTEVIKLFLLNSTPVEVIILSMLFSTAYISRTNIETLGRMAVFVLPIILITTLVFVIITIPVIDFSNILPLFRFNFKDIGKVLIETGFIFFSYVGFEILFISMAYLENEKKVMKYGFKGIMVIIIIYLITFFITLAGFGVFELKREIWPSLSIIREVELPGFFIENIDGIILSAWIIVVFATLGPAIYSGSVILSKIFNTKRHNYFVLPMIPIILTLSLIPQNIGEVYFITQEVLKYLGTFLLIICPITLYIIALIKKGVKNHN